MRHAVPKSIETMLCVDDFSRYKIVAFMAKKSDATAVLRAITAKFFAPAGLNIGVIRTDNGGEFQGACAIIWRQAVTWHPAAGAGGDIPLAAATGGGIKGDENHSPQLEELAVRMGTLGAELGSEEQGGSEESREIPGDIPLEPELPEELLEPPKLPEMQLDVDEPETGLGTLEDEELEPDWQAEQRDAPAALRKLRNSFTDN